MTIHIDMEANKLRFTLSDLTRTLIQISVIIIAVYAIYARLDSSVQILTQKIDFLVEAQKINNQTVITNSQDIRVLESRVTILEQQLQFLSK